MGGAGKLNPQTGARDMGKITIEEDELSKLIRKEIRRSGGSEEERDLDETEDRFNRLGDRLEDLLESPKKKKKSGGLLSGGMSGFGQIQRWLNTMNIDAAARYAVEQCGKVSKGPASNGSAIGGNPSQDPTNHVNNGRILAWTVNGVVYNARSIVAVLTYMLVLLQWNMIDLVMGGGDEDEESLLGGGDNSMFEDLIMLQAVIGSNFGGVSGGSGGSGILGSLGGLASIFGGGTKGAVLDSTPFYATV